MYHSFEIIFRYDKRSWIYDADIMCSLKWSELCDRENWNNIVSVAHKAELNNNMLTYCLVFF